MGKVLSASRVSFKTCTAVPELHATWFNDKVAALIPDTRPFDHAGHLADLYPESLQLALIEMWVEGPTDDDEALRLDDWRRRWKDKLHLVEVNQKMDDWSIAKRQRPYYREDSYIVQECIYMCSPKYQRLIELMMLRDMTVTKAARELGQPHMTVWDQWQIAKVQMQDAYLIVTKQ